VQHVRTAIRAKELD